MATISGVSLSTPTRIYAAKASPESPNFLTISMNSQPWKRSNQLGAGRMRLLRPVAAAPDGLSGKVEESIKQAQEACAGDPVSGECVAAWDEVEELSAAVSHARDKKKDSDPLETYCADNPETDECRTYDN